MLSRPTWAALYSWSVIKTVLYFLDCDPFEACLILILDSFFLEKVVDFSDIRLLSVLARHSCGKVRFFDYPDHFIHHPDALQCMHAALLEAWRLYRGLSTRARSKAMEPYSELAWG